MWPNNLHRLMKQIPGVRILFWGVNALLRFHGCTEKKTDRTQVFHPVETAELVSHVTSDIVSSTDEIWVGFVEPQVKRNVVGQVLKKSVFSFSPSIDGIAQWEDERSLVFRPNAPLPLRENYRGTLDIAALLSRKEVRPLTFRFAVAGRKIAYVRGDFELHQENGPHTLIYSGSGVFTEKTALDVVKKAARLRLGSEALSLSWKAEAGGKDSPSAVRPSRGAIRNKDSC